MSWDNDISGQISKKTIISGQKQSNYCPEIISGQKILKMSWDNVYAKKCPEIIHQGDRKMNTHPKKEMSWDKEKKWKMSWENFSELNQHLSQDISI